MIITFKNNMFFLFSKQDQKTDAKCKQKNRCSLFVDNFKQWGKNGGKLSH